MQPPKTVYTLTGHEVPAINLAEQFAKFAATITGKPKEPIGLGQENSKLNDHGNNIMKQKEKES